MHLAHFGEAARTLHAHVYERAVGKDHIGGLALLPGQFQPPGFQGRQQGLLVGGEPFGEGGA